jgi:vancomycin resistance protein YoaR
MNKKTWILIVIVLAILIGVGVFFYFQNTTPSESNENTYEANRTSTNNTSNATSQQANQTENTAVNEVKQGIAEAENNKPAPVKEEQIATFSTKIYSTDSARQNNVSITCNTLNETIVKNGETFSFCGTVGQASSSKGYQKADIFDKDGNKKKGLGGGNCQISSTLYNAVLAVPTLVVTERHSHSNYVPYIAKGKDAAVAYGSYDFKFRNDSRKRYQNISFYG